MKTTYAKGMDALNKLHGGHTGESLVAAMGQVSPKMVAMTIEWVFGDLMQDATLDFKTKELTIIASLIPQGTLPQIKVHIEAALNVGVSQSEIVALIEQSAIYAGFPHAVNAMLTAKEVFEVWEV